MEFNSRERRDLQMEEILSFERLSKHHKRVPNKVYEWERFLCFHSSVPSFIQQTILRPVCYRLCVWCWGVCVCVCLHVCARTHASGLKGQEIVREEDMRVTWGGYRIGGSDIYSYMNRNTRSDN